MSDQLTDAWRESRHGLITASRADQLVTPKAGKVSASAATLGHRLAAERYTGQWIDETGTSWAMARGIEREPGTRARYSFERDADVTESGFIRSGEIGCSPDGLIGEDGGLEIKNPLIAGYMKAAIHVYETGEVPPEYVCQCRLSLMVTDRAWWDLCVDYPDMPLVVVRLYRDEAAEAQMQAGIDACLDARDAALAALHEMSGTALEAAA